jgi:AraC-like DNA-binding protein
MQKKYKVIECILVGNIDTLLECRAMIEKINKKYRLQISDFFMISLFKNLFLPRNRVIRFCMIIFPLILSVPLCVDLTNATRDIFPTQEFGNRVHAYADIGWKGHSTIDRFHVDGKIITLEYTLHEGAQYPMVFFLISLDVNGKACDLSGYDKVSIRMREATTKRILIYIKTFMPGVSQSGGEYAGTLRHNEYTLLLDPEMHEYEIGLHRFVTSKWWLDERKIDPYGIPPEKYDRVISLDMQFNPQGSDYMLGRQEKISIEKIYFSRLPALPAVALAIVMCIYYAVAGFLAFRSRKAAQYRQIPEQKHLDVTSIRDEQLHRIKAFLEAHYFDPDISTRMIYTTLGIPPARVFNLLKESYNLSFKQIINKMRIEEAKHLLLDSDLRITEIAMKLGFGQQSYFNRLFKKHEGISPSDYRDSAR